MYVIDFMEGCLREVKGYEVNGIPDAMNTGTKIKRDYGVSVVSFLIK